MDIEHIRDMVKREEVRASSKFQQRMVERDFTFKQAEDAIMCGRILDTETKRGKPDKHIITGFVDRDGILDELCIELAITDVVIFISGYWPNDSTRRRR